MCSLIYEQEEVKQAGQYQQEIKINDTGHRLLLFFAKA